MKEKEVAELMKTKDGRFLLVYRIVAMDNMSIADIVIAKESATNDKISNLSKSFMGLALRATAIFSNKKALEQVKPLIAKDIIESGAIGGTPFEEKLKEIAK